MKFSITTLLLAIGLIGVATAFLYQPPKHDSEHFCQTYCDGMQPPATVARLYDESIFGGDSPAISYKHWNRTDKKALVPVRMAQLIDSCIVELKATGVFEGMALKTWDDTILDAKIDAFGDYLAIPPFVTPEQIKNPTIDPVSGFNRTTRLACLRELERIILSSNTDSSTFPRMLDEIPNATGPHSFHSYLRIRFFVKARENLKREGHSIDEKLNKLIEKALVEPRAKFE